MAPECYGCDQWCVSPQNKGSRRPLALSEVNLSALGPSDAFWLCAFALLWPRISWAPSSANSSIAIPLIIEWFIMPELPSKCMFKNKKIIVHLEFRQLDIHIPVHFAKIWMVTSIKSNVVNVAKRPDNNMYRTGHVKCQCAQCTKLLYLQCCTGR
jgi:hypothetical protein